MNHADMNAALIEALSIFISKAGAGLLVPVQAKFEQMDQRLTAIETRLREQRLDDRIDAAYVMALRSDVDQLKLTVQSSTSEDRMREIAEEVMEDHTSSYDHDDYDTTSSNLNDYDLSEFVTRDEIGTVVRDEVRDLSFSVTVD